MKLKDGGFKSKRWMDLHLSVDGEGADWVTEPKGAIKKANLTFTVKFFWLIVCHCLSPTAADNIVWVRGAFCVASTGDHARGGF